MVGVEKKEEFSNLLLQKNISGLKRFCLENKIEKELADFIISLPRLNGDIDVLNKTIDGLKYNSLRESLIVLKNLYIKMNMKEQDLFDLACVPNMEYYTGIIFNVYSKYVEEPIISGGRYDKLSNTFGKNISSIGMAYYMNVILKAIEKAGEDSVKNGIN